MGRFAKAVGAFDHVTRAWTAYSVVSALAAGGIAGVLALIQSWPPVHIVLLFLAGAVIVYGLFVIHEIRGSEKARVIPRPPSMREATNAALQTHLAADRADALRELAKLRDFAPRKELDLLGGSPRLHECFGAIGPDAEGEKYLIGFLKHDRETQLAFHTVEDTPETREWKWKAYPFHLNARMIYRGALEKWLRGQDAEAYFKIAWGNISEQAPPDDPSGTQYTTVGTEPYVQLLRKVNG